MKLAEPFAGYTYAYGHYVFHMAFFLGTWFVDPNTEHLLKGGTVEDEVATHMKKAFYQLRYCNLICFLISAVVEIS